MTDILCFRFGVKITFGTTEIENKIIVLEIDLQGLLHISKHVTFEKNIVSMYSKKSYLKL